MEADLLKNNDLITFKHKVFGEVPIIALDGKHYFGANEVAIALGYTNFRKAILDHCRKDGVTKRDSIDSIGRSQQKNFISEGNLYRLIVKSRLPQAEEFEAWVFDELLPTIREDGMYITDNATDQQKKFNFKMLTTTFASCDVGRLAAEYEECMKYYAKKRLPYMKKVKGRRCDSKHSLPDSKIMVMEKIKETLEVRESAHKALGEFAHVSLISDVIKKANTGILTIRHNKTIGKLGASTKELESYRGA